MSKRGHTTFDGKLIPAYRIIDGKRVRWHDFDDSRSGDAADAGQVADQVNSTRHADIDWNNIPRRPWMAGNRLLRGYVTLLTGPGGVGKTALTMTCALSFALGRNLLDPGNANPHWRLHGGPQRTYIYSLEDDLAETTRRMSAVQRFHGVAPHEADDYLLYGDGSTDRLILAVTEPGRKLVRTALADKLIDHLIENQVDILILDPFVKMHSCNENDNMEMDFTMVVLKEVAAKANCALWLVHHSGKAGTSMDPHGGRGASSIPAAGRVNETLSAATKEDRDRFGFADGVVCLETTKSNMAAIRDGNTQWLRLLSHEVGNGEYAQVLELLDPKNNAERMDDVLFAGLRDAVLTPPDGGGVWLTKEGAGNWIGRALRDGGIGTDARAKAMVQEWIKLGLLVSDLGARDSQGRPLKSAVKLDEARAEQYARSRWGG